MSDSAQQGSERAGGGAEDGAADQPSASAPGLRHVARGVSWVALGHIVSQLSWIGSLAFLAALLDPGAVGTVTIAMVIVQVAWLVVGSGTRGSLVLARKTTTDQLGGAVVLNVGSGLLLGGAIAALASPLLGLLAPGADPDVLRVLTLSVLFYGFSIVPLALLQKEFRFRSHAACVGGAALLASILAVIAALAGAGVWALVARQIVFQFLSASFAWVTARQLLPSRRRLHGSLLRAAVTRRPHAFSFFALALMSFIAGNVDYVIVGRLTDVSLLGTYALAFALAFAPQTHFAWQVGKVLFPATAATSDPDAVRRRALKAVRLAALVLLPLVPAGIVLAPVVLPTLLGPEWEPMIVPFQILLIVGISHGVLAIVREFLLGAGHASLCARLEGLWLGAQIVTLILLVPAYGIRGAAVAHLVVLVPLGVAYAWLGARRLHIKPSELARALARVGGPAVAQGGVTAALWITLDSAAPALLGSTIAAVAGLAVFIALASRGSGAPVREGREMLAAAVLRRAS